MIEFSNVTKTYKAGNKAIRKLNIQIADGEFVFIVGRSGSGKSTLLKMLLKEVEPTSGCILVGGQNLQRMPKRAVPRYRRGLGMVFQDFKLLKDRTVYENVAFAQRVIGVSQEKSGRMCRPCCGWWVFRPNTNFILSSCPAESSSGWPSPGR